MESSPWKASEVTFTPTLHTQARLPPGTVRLTPKIKSSESSSSLKFNFQAELKPKFKPELA